MRLYLDVIFIINFCFDFLLLLTTKLILKKKTTIKRLLQASLVGDITLFTLFLKLNNIELFLIKLLLSICMIRISFKESKKERIKTLFSFYMVSFFLGGALYAINIQTSYQKEGFIFYHRVPVNFFLIVLLTPILLFIYKNQKKEEVKKQQIKEVEIVLKNNKVYHLNAFLDTGCKIKDPYLHRNIVLASNIDIKGNYILVPYHTIVKKELIKCYPIRYVKIKNQIFKNVLLGIVDKIPLENIDCIIGENLWEEL